MTKYEVFSGPYFPVFGLNMEIYEVNVNSVFSPNAGKYGPEKTPYLDTFHTVRGKCKPSAAPLMFSIIRYFLS